MKQPRHEKVLQDCKEEVAKRMGYANFNWGIPHHQVFRTRKEAIKSIEENMGEKWIKCKKYMRVEKVECFVI